MSEDARVQEDSGAWRELAREQHAWRERALRGVSWVLATAGGFAGLWTLVKRGYALSQSLALLGAAVVIALAPMPRRWSFALRVNLVLGALYLACLAALLKGGFVPNAFMGFGMVVLSATLLLGRRSALTFTGLCVATIFSVSLLHGAGVLQRVPGWVQLLDSASLSVGLRVTLIFLLLSSTTVIAVSYLLGRTEDLLVRHAESLESLQRTQRERERIAKDLELRQAAFHKARELELLGRLAGTMAHDFNNALLVIGATLDELDRESGLPPSVVECCGLIRAAADQASASARQLRAFHPMAARRTTALALSPAIQKAGAMFSRLLPPNIHLQEDLQVEATIVADEGELLRVLMNLALNARDAMQDGGQLTLLVRSAGAHEVRSGEDGEDFVVVEVQDAGIGMSDEVKARLFEPFFTTKETGGTGLGLASVREIVETQGGRVMVESALGAGTTISVLWPRARRGVASQIAPKPSLREAANVLLVEDEPGVRAVLTRGLERAGMRVIPASNASEGILSLRRHAGTIDVLCTDCLMTGVPVRQLIAAYRSQHRGPIIVCSGYAPVETGLTSDQFDDFIQKPFSVEDLLERIAAALDAPGAAAAEPCGAREPGRTRPEWET